MMLTRLVRWQPRLHGRDPRLCKTDPGAPVIHSIQEVL
jgi:hypothetical protein